MNKIGNFSALILAIITFGMALLQLSLIFGAPLGEYVLGGQYKVLPANMRFLSCAYVIAFTFVGLVYLQKGHYLNIGFNSTFVIVLILINTLFLAYAIIGNGFLTKSLKERAVMTPFSIIQFLLSLAVLFAK